MKQSKFLTHVARPLFIFFVLDPSFSQVASFTIPVKQIRLSSNLFSAASVKDLKSEIQNEIKTTKRGINASPEKAAKIDNLVKLLEEQCPYAEPARQTSMQGKWIVDYTTAPPPSNGKLGPFVGIARQIIDLDNGTYTNYLSVPGDIGKEWLSAKLVATFEEWDGTLLSDGNEEESESFEKIADDNTEVEESSSNWLEASIGSMFQQKNSNKSSRDYGADSWKVDFKKLTIKVFGLELIKKTFSGTSRIWKMSYLDDEGTRIGKFTIHAHKGYYPS